MRTDPSMNSVVQCRLTLMSHNLKCLRTHKLNYYQFTICTSLGSLIPNDSFLMPVKTTARSATMLVVAGELSKAIGVVCGYSSLCQAVVLISLNDTSNHIGINNYHKCCHSNQSIGRLPLQHNNKTSIIISNTTFKRNCNYSARVNVIRTS